MKLQITMKTPDAVDTAIEDAGVDEDTAADCREICERWFRWGEYVTLEVDTKNKSIKVVGAN